MKKSLCLIAALLCAASIAQASDVVQNGNHKHLLKTDRSAYCDTPSGKMSKRCGTENRNAAPAHVRSF